jgi:hypothetical protein
VTSSINKTFRRKSRDYSQLVASLKVNDHIHFSGSLRALIQENGEFGLSQDLAAIASQSELALGWLTGMYCKQDEDEVLGRVAFGALLSVGIGAMAALRQAWDREQSQRVRGRIHLCMMDLIGIAGHTAEQTGQMPFVADREIPAWLETLRTAEPRVQCWAVMILIRLAPFAPAKIGEIRAQFSAFLASDLLAADDLSKRDFAAMRRFASGFLGN